MEQKCPFCEKLAQLKDLDEYYAKPNCETEYTAALVENSYFNKNFCGQAAYHNFKLNYCPVCGKKLNETTTNEKQGEKIMTYSQLKDKQQNEVNQFPIGAAFNKKQFAEMMNKWGLQITDADKICSIGTGIYLRKTDVPAFNALAKKLHKELQDAINNEETGEEFIYQMFAYELDNHEYCITYDLEETLDALGYTLEEIKSNPKLLKGLEKALSKYKL